MKYIIGSDEVGYGAWAGPLIVCAVAVPAGWAGPPELDDSKAFKSASEKVERAILYGKLQDLPMFLACIGNEVIDQFGIKAALVRAHGAALNNLLQRFPDAEVIVDGIVPIPEVPQARCIPRADGLYPAVMAASVIAKVNRDFLMRQYHTTYPHYGFDTNVGYGGGKKHAHTLGLQKHGVCPLHRRSCGPIKAALLAQRQINLFEES